MASLSARLMMLSAVPRITSTGAFTSGVAAQPSYEEDHGNFPAGVARAGDEGAQLVAATVTHPVVKHVGVGKLLTARRLGGGRRLRGGESEEQDECADKGYVALGGIGVVHDECPRVLVCRAADSLGRNRAGKVSRDTPGCKRGWTESLAEREGFYFRHPAKVTQTQHLWA